VSRLLVVVSMVMVAAVASLAPATPVSAGCGGSTTIDGDGGGVDGYCWGSTPGPRPNTDGLSQAELWAIWCSRDWADGSSVTFERVHVLTLDDIVYWGLDPTGVYHRWNVNCLDPDGNNVGGSIEYWETSPPVAPEVLRAAAAARISPAVPSVESNPPFNEPGRFGIVNFPTWFWINDPWETIGPESETSGFVTVEVSATPRKVTWKAGDGSELVVCDGPGIPWAAGLPEDASDCTHTFTSSSADLPGQQYALSATVEWYFEWWINGVYQGEFGSFDSIAPFTYQVGEIQTVEVN